MPNPLKKVKKAVSNVDDGLKRALEVAGLPLEAAAKVAEVAAQGAKDYYNKKPKEGSQPLTDADLARAMDMGTGMSSGTLRVVGGGMRPSGLRNLTAVESDALDYISRKLGGGTPPHVVEDIASKVSRTVDRVSQAPEAHNTRVPRTRAKLTDEIVELNKKLRDYRNTLQTTSDPLTRYDMMQEIPLVKRWLRELYLEYDNVGRLRKER